MVVAPLLIPVAEVLVPLLLALLLWGLSAWLRPILQAMAAGDQPRPQSRGLWNTFKKALSTGLLDLVAPGVKQWLGRKLTAALKEVEHFVAVTISRAAAGGIAATARW